MGLTIEVSFNICKQGNITNIKQLLSTIAEKYNSKTNYFIHEIEGHNRVIDCNDYVNIVEFESDNFTNIIEYLKSIIKIKVVKIDCIYYDEGVVNLIYASKKYLLVVNKNSCNPFLTNFSINKIIELIEYTIN